MTNDMGSVLARALREKVWEDTARVTQLPPAGNWRIWVLLGGRGAGKTRSAAEYVRAKVEAGEAKRIALVGRTSADVRDVMVEGPSGLLAIAPPWFRPHYEPSKRRLTWLNAAVATTFSGDEPDLLRGPQHDLAWVDELCAFEKPDEVWNTLLLGLRLGAARCVVTTTPRPIPLLRALVARHGQDVHLARMTTFENIENLSAAFAADIATRYANTRLGRQELYAEILTDTPGALWTRDVIDRARVQAAPDLERVVVAIDPATTANEGSDETGIVVVGRGTDEHFYILADYSMRGSPDAWGRKGVTAYTLYQADRIVAETNNGGDLVEHVIRTVDPSVLYKAVHASRGKVNRAEPIAALYEQGKVHHVGLFADLEEQMCGHVSSGPSPDRMDALVWAVTELLGGNVHFWTYSDRPVKAEVVPGQPLPSWIW